MEDQYISRKTAELAREKGFNEPTMNHWEEGTDGNGEGLFTADTLLTNAQLTSTYKVDGKTYGEWSAPTQSLLQKWLRDTHKLHINVYHDKESCYSSCDAPRTWYWLIHRNTITSGDVYESYEQALETGLQAALKMI